MALVYQKEQMSNTKRELMLNIVEILVEQELLTAEEKIRAIDELNKVIEK